MIFKIQKPIISSDGIDYYLVYNKNRDIMFNDIEVGQVPQLDRMFNDELKIYVEGYLDKKDRLVIKRKIENQNW